MSGYLLLAENEKLEAVMQLDDDGHPCLNERGLQIVMLRLLSNEPGGLVEEEWMRRTNACARELAQNIMTATLTELFFRRADVTIGVAEDGEVTYHIKPIP